METCPVCGEKAVTEDIENGQKVRVCTECGAMDSDMQELTSADQFEGTTISDGNCYGPAGGKRWMKTTSSCAERNKALGKKLITNIGIQLKVGDVITKEACQLYERVYDNELHNTLVDSKKTMCMACLYSSARMHKFSINIRELGFFLNIKNSARRFGSALKCLKHKYNVHLPPIDIQNEAYRVLSQSDLPGDIVKTANQILSIMQRAMITTGRCCMSYAVPCAYFAFKASDIAAHWRLTFKAFCKKFNFRKTLKYGCKPEVEKTLKAMAKELPWVKGLDVEVDRVEVHIKDIIKYQSSLFAQAVLTAVNEMEDTDKEVTEVCPDMIEDPGYIFRSCPKRKQAEEKTGSGDTEGLPAEKKQKIKSEKRAERDFDKQYSGNSSGLESFDLGSDDDTDHYILSSKEVMIKKEVNKRFGLHNEEEEDAVYVDVDEQTRNLTGLEKFENVKEENANNASQNAVDTNDEDGDDDDDDGDYGDNDRKSIVNYLFRRQTNSNEEGDEGVDFASSDDDNYYD
ncbi:transcription factor IIIB 50 kDa subunit-like [Mercenaria mercenaria]|uniref:transcription factor IIIB 50 kDa subunit-like n=1 Tax=Mercenaria mercenaria TaxID=6596 RepID=UPI00234E3B96|nr:transcription factor IIIB 50 kDa subunit-like [Mercenaria mercenaria]